MPDHDPIDTAWRLHAAQVEWISKVDSKASFALAIESAVLLFVADATRDGVLAGVASSRGGVLFWLGILALITGVVMAVSVVAPDMRPKKTVEEIRTKDFIHFGHVRHWTADELADSLNSKELLPAMTDQIVILSKIAWSKHVRVEWALGLGMLGGFFIGLAAFV